jgi:branched-chain amino acid transport system substrate-binding protein
MLGEHWAGRMWRLALVPAALVFMLALAACGSSSSSSSGESTTETAGSTAAETTAAAPKGEPLKIVGLMDVTGPTSGHQGGAISVVKAWVKETNAAGGVAGHPVEFESEDTQGNSSKAVADAEKVIGDSSVLAVVVVDASTESALLPVLSKAGVPVIGGVAFSPVVWGATTGNKVFKHAPLPNVFTINTAFPASVASYLSAAQKLGAKTITGISFSEVPASAQGVELVEAWAPTVGIKASGLTIQVTAPSYTAQCLELEEQGSEFAFMSLPDSVARRFIEDCNAQGYEGAYGVTGGAVTPEVFTNSGESELAGGLWGFPWYVDTPPVERYRSIVEANNIPNEEWEGGSGQVLWTTMELFKTTLDANKAKLATPVTRENVIAAYHTIKDQTLGGLLPGPVTFVPGEEELPACYWLFTASNGEFTGGAKPTCPPASLGAG